MAQKVFQKYDYPHMQYQEPPVQYRTFKPGALMLASSNHQMTEEVTFDNQYRYLEGGISGAIFQANPMNQMFTPTETRIYVSETRWFDGYIASDNSTGMMRFGADQTDGATAQGVTSWTATWAVPRQPGDTVYWYVDEVPGTTPDGASCRFLRIMLLVVHSPAIGTALAHVYTSSTQTVGVKSWMSGVNATAKLPEDEDAIDDGDWDDSSDDIGIPGFPSVDVLSAGLLRAYVCDAAQINNLASEIWSGNFLQQIENYFTSPAEALVNVGILPFKPTSGNVDVAIKMGNYTCSSAKGKVVTSQWYSINMGSFTLKEFYGSYLDYDSHVSIFLPYIGSRQLNTVDVMGAKLKLVYHIDVISGSVTAMLECTKKTKKGHKLNSTLYEWAGNCFSGFPLSSTNAAQKAAGLVQSLGTIAAGVGTIAATGGAGAAVGAGIIASGIAAAAQSQVTHYSRCGGITPDTALIGLQTAYVVVTRPRMSVPSQYYAVRGGQTYSSGLNGVKTLGAFDGLTVCEKILVSGLNATQEEKDEIQQLAREGLIL